MTDHPKHICGLSPKPLVKKTTWHGPQKRIRPDVRYGSIATFWRSADHFRYSPISRHSRSRLICLKGADSVAKVPKAAAAKFSPKNETSDNRRSIEPQN